MMWPWRWTRRAYWEGYNNGLRSGIVYGMTAEPREQIGHFCPGRLACPCCAEMQIAAERKRGLYHLP